MKRLTLEGVIASPQLPSLSAVATRIVELVQDPNVGLSQLAEAIGQDPALTSRILRTANSSFYSRTRAVGKLSDALMLLGLRRVKALALGFSLVGNHRGPAGGTDGEFDYTRFWQRSVFAAVGARVLASQIHGADTEEAFVGGLLHGIGVLILSQAAGGEYQQLLARANGDYAELRGLESEEFGFNHAQLAGRLGDAWSLPAALTASMRWFATPDLAPEQVRVLVACVGAGSAASDLFVAPHAVLGVVAYRDLCRRWFQMKASESDPLLVRIQDETAEMHTLLDLPAPASVSIGEVLWQAGDALDAIQQAVRENQGTPALLSPAAGEPATDGLTGLASRARLQEHLEDWISVSRLQDTPLSYLHVEIDDFITFKRTHGHAAGDAVLRVVAERIGREAGGEMAGRCGPEAFAVVAPERNLRAAVELAQRLRLAVEGLIIYVGHETFVRVTVSIGVAMLDWSWPSPAEGLAHAAASALGQSRAAGTNTVRIASAALPAA